jgi:hypothetical protein
VRVEKLVPESLASSTVLDREGRQILLESFWAEEPAVLVFYAPLRLPLPQCPDYGAFATPLRAPPTRDSHGIHR